MGKQLSHLIASAVIRRGNEVLLVNQQGPGDPEPSWALPGGRVETGELLPEALAREVREETGLVVLNAGHLAYVAQLDNPAGHVWVAGEVPAPGSQATAFVFAVAEWSGELRSADPDGFVRECRFVPLLEAIRLLEMTLPWPVMRDPAVAYLRGKGDPGSLWIFRREAPNQDCLVFRLP